MGYIDDFIRFATCIHFYEIFILNIQGELVAYFDKGSVHEFLGYLKNLKIICYCIFDDKEEVRLVCDLKIDKGE